MNEIDFARRFGTRSGMAAREGNAALANAERDAFRIWIDLLAPGHAGHELRGMLEREFARAYHEAKGTRPGEM
ncbi:MAG: hypothetical protein JXB62_14515 [Pirellulales bacterium]|nr:hypothetical protein [Pirellulales bacterium]